MATAVASRFAVLCDDVDDDYSNRKKRPQQPPAKPAKPPAANPKVNNNKKKKNKENTQTQSVKPKPKSESAGTVKKKKEVTPEQWEEWRQKDEHAVDVNYKDDMTQAILLSKLDFEEKKDLYEQAKTADPKPPEPVDKKPGGKKNKKTIKVLSVEEFHNLGKVKSREDSPSAAFVEPVKDDTEFFNRLQAEVKKELSKDKSPPKKVAKAREPFDEEALTLAKARDALDRKLQEVQELKEENNNLREELKDVKTRNKKLCHILANGEMKEKAEVLVEVERLQTVRDELSEQVASLHAQLEQERSKVRALSNDSKTKDKNKKRTTSSGEQ